MPNLTARDAWDQGRPVYSRLPNVGFRDNQVANWLTTWADEELVKVREVAQEFYRTLDPDLCPVGRLDYCAWFYELTGSYWDVRWSEQVKRDMIRSARSYLWLHRGTAQVVKKVLDIHGIAYSLWVPRALLVPFNLPGTFGGGALRWYLRLPIDYRRNGYQWKEAVRTVDNFAPVITKHKVVYRKFYLGFSVIGDPLFR